MMTVDQDFPVPDLSGLSEDEKRQLLNVMKKAKEFEHREDMDFQMRQPLAGQLYKYTNVVKGWQHRWFQLDPQHGRLDYFEKEEYRKQKPRGTLHLAGAQISPSDEDEQTFSINAANGELYRLRAFDAKERQHWVNRLRATAEHHTDLLLQTQSGQGWDRGSLQGSVDSLNRSQESLRKSQPTKSKPPHSQQQYSTSAIKRSPVIITRRSQYKTVSNAPVSAAPPAETQFREVREMLTTVSHQQSTLSYRIEDLPGTPACTDRDMLMLKATSAATLACLDQCLAILQQQTNQTLMHAETASKSTFYVPRGGSISPAESFMSVASVLPMNDASAARIPPLHDTYTRIHHADEVEDKESYKDTDLQGVEEHKSIILHLLSQLKLGMDLTKVVLPTFILEKRSLLEMFADCMAHPDLFLRIPDQADPALRMLAVVEWYLTSFHAARQGCQAKKPYNPIIGEHFHCSWQLPKDHPCSQTTHVSSSQSAATANQSSQSEPLSSGTTDQSSQSKTNSETNSDKQETASKKLQTEQDSETKSESIKKKKVPTATLR